MTVTNRSLAGARCAYPTNPWSYLDGRYRRRPARVRWQIWGMPQLVILTGPIAAGKNTVADKIAHR
jgi:hypothetical protein